MENKLETLQKVIESRLKIELNKKTRKQEYIFARALFYALAYDGTRFTYSSIGRYIGRDHATVLHSVKNVFPQIISQKRYKRLYDELRLLISDDVDQETKLHENGILNLYNEIEKKDSLIQELSLKLIRAQNVNEVLKDALNGLTPEETETLLDKMILTSKVIKKQRMMYA